MRALTIFMLLVSIVWAEEISFKMILSSHIKSEEAAKSLYAIETFFEENSKAKELKKKYDLLIGMELLDKYILVTINPIKASSLKGSLQLLFKEKFPKSFMVRNVDISNIEKVTKMHHASLPFEVIKTKPTESNTPIKQSFWRNIDSAWFGLILLALAGLLLVYRSTRQISEIKALQKEVAKYQIILEDEINSMGSTHA